ncbi:MAG TPA: PilZ domain-containing protein [Pirellulales bacterium]|jgi:hypothetical protein
MIRPYAIQRLTSAYDRLAARAWEKHVHHILSTRRIRFRRDALLIHESGDRFYVLSRDISKGGLGLAHDREMPAGKVRISVDVGNGRAMKAPARLVWCRQSEDGSYVSGIEFLAVPIVHMSIVTGNVAAIA